MPKKIDWYDVDDNNDMPNSRDSRNPGKDKLDEFVHSPFVVPIGPDSRGKGRGKNNPQAEKLGLIDYAKRVDEFEHISFRDDVMDDLLTVLSSKTHPNALLVGEAGTGKTAIVEELALRISEGDKETVAMLGEDAHVYELPIANLMSNTSLRGSLESKMNKIIEFCENPDNHVILFIDEIHQMVSNPDPAVTESLKPALARGKMHVIGATTTQELKILQKNPAFNRRFSEVNVRELTDEETVSVLVKASKSLEDFHHVAIPEEVLPYAVATADKLARTLNTHRPDSALSLLDKAASFGKLGKAKLDNDNEDVFVSTGLIDKASQNILKSDFVLDKDTISAARDNLSENLIAQDKASRVIVRSLLSSMINLEETTKPRSFLFAGPSGTGKTLAAKLLAESLFGSPDKMVYLNMSEFASPSSLSRLLGASAGYIGFDSRKALPLDSLKTNPCQIIVLDEFEKADVQVQRIFMQALDEGYIRDSQDDMIDFSHSFVIATTNAGVVKENKVGFGQVESNADVTESLAGSFPVELINRFEKVVMFDSIGLEDYQRILALNYNKLAQAASENYPDIPDHMDADDDFIVDLAKKTYDPMKNARPAKRSVKEAIEDVILETVFVNR